MAKFGITRDRLNNLSDIELQILTSQASGKDQVSRDRAISVLKQHRERNLPAVIGETMPAVIDAKPIGPGPTKVYKNKGATARSWDVKDPTPKISAKAKEKVIDKVYVTAKAVTDEAADAKATLAADAIEKYGVKAAAAAIALIGVASVADHMMKNDDKKRSQKQQKIQKKQHDSKQERSLEDRSTGMIEQPYRQGLVQEMFAGRIGHSNTWGGTRY